MHYLIDNYDSFTYNLYQLIGTLTDDPIKVVKNDAITVDELRSENPDSIILSPGPGRPENAGNMPAILQEFIGKVPIFGVCLGHQAIAQAYGAKIIHAPQLMHGKSSLINVSVNNGLFTKCPETFEAARYHSLIVDSDSIPTHLTVTAKTTDHEVMAIADEKNDVYGVQFHPESIMTDPVVGKQIVTNFLKMATKTIKQTI